MSRRKEVNAAAAEATEQLFRSYLAALNASHSQVHVTRTEDVLHGKVEIKIVALAKSKGLSA